MAVVTSDFLAATFQGFRALFQTAYNEYVPEWEGLATEVPSSNLEEVHNWLGSPADMQEWVDEKVPKGLYAHNFTIRNKNWESTLEVDRNTLEDDQLGLIAPRVRDLGVAARRHPGKLIYELVRDGASTLCYDGQYFFDTDHSEGTSGAQSNLLTGTGTTAAQVEVDMASVITAMMAFKDDRGIPFGNISPDTIMVPASGAIFLALRRMAGATTIGDNTNVLGGFIRRVLINPYLTDTNDWYAFDTSHAVRAFIFQRRSGPTFNQLTNPNATESVFLRRKYLYSVESRDNAGYGMWQFGIKITNT